MYSLTLIFGECHQINQNLTSHTKHAKKVEQDYPCIEKLHIIIHLSREGTILFLPIILVPHTKTRYRQLTRCGNTCTLKLLYLDVISTNFLVTAVISPYIYTNYSHDFRPFTSRYVWK